jgi:hypothetical protein
MAIVTEAARAPTWAYPDKTRSDPASSWQAVDRALRSIAQARAALDAEQARWLREAQALQIWKPLGMVSALDYMERQLGYAPRTAQDKLRVARALGALPHLTPALRLRELGFSAIREPTRVATPATEAAWISAALGKNVRQVEDLVADHHLGDRPDDPTDPTARRRGALRAQRRDLRGAAPGARSRTAPADAKPREPSAQAASSIDTAARAARCQLARPCATPARSPRPAA